MIDKLKQIEEKMLLELLSKPEIWKTTLIDYHLPIVERIWTQVGNYRISLHFIHKCETKDALFHPHPWSSAIHILTGNYEMGLGYGQGLVEPEKMCTILVENGGMYYDMTHIDGWHYVRSVSNVCATVMLTGKPWGREEIKNEKPLKALDNERKNIILNWFSNFYKNKFQNQRVVDNKNIEKGNWIIIDENLINGFERRGYEKYFKQNGFVIKKEGNLVDVRFGNDRIQIQSRFLKLLDKIEKIEEKKDVEKVAEIKKDFRKMDDMDPKNWDNDLSTDGILLL